MSKVRMSVRSRRMVRRNREFFRLMDETGLSADQLRGFLEVKEALAKALASISSAASKAVEGMAVALSSVTRAIDAAIRASEKDDEEMGE